VAGTLANNTPTVNTFLKNLPVKMSQIARLASYGSWLNLFMCDALVSGVKEKFGPNPTGVPITAARCQ
jgi:phospholipid/cholesterol/gamma-HCH transport system substrate-binding protein